jgi:hypothetical protein
MFRNKKYSKENYKVRKKLEEICRDDSYLLRAHTVKPARPVATDRRDDVIKKEAVAARQPVNSGRCYATAHKLQQAFSVGRRDTTADFF